MKELSLAWYTVAMKLVVVQMYNSRLEAEIAKGLLAANGIRAHISADDEGGLMAYPFTLVKGVRLTVAETDLKKAEAVLAG